MIRPAGRKDNAFAKEWGLENIFVIGYSGNLGRAHGVDTFLAAMTALERPGSLEGGGCHDWERQIRWLFIGGGAQMDALKCEVEKRNLKNVLFRPYQSQELLSESLSLPDVHLISLRPELEGLIVPSKYYGIAAAGRPAIFVGHPEGEIARTIKQSETGIVVREGDGDGLAAAIRAFASNPDLASLQGERARALFEAKFDFPLALEAWEQAIQEVRRATS